MCRDKEKPIDIDKFMFWKYKLIKEKLAYKLALVTDIEPTMTPLLVYPV